MKISFSGFMLDSSGYGEAARRMLPALQRSGHEMVCGMTLRDGGWEVRDAPRDVLAFLKTSEWNKGTDVHIAHVSAIDSPGVWEYAEGLGIGQGRKVLMTLWETDQLHPKVIEAAKLADAVIVPSNQNLTLFTEAGIKRVFKVPYPCREDAPVYGPEDLAPEMADIGEKTLAFYCLMTWQERKNPLGLLKAYLHAFSGEDDVVLAIKVSGGSAGAAGARAKAEVERVVKAAQHPDPPRILVLAGEWSEKSIWAFHERGDCYVTMTRGEGAALPLFDAWASGHSVIAPDWGGHLDYCKGPFMSGVNLVHTSLTPVLQDYSHFSITQCWAEPSVLDAAGVMRTVAKKGRVNGWPREVSYWSVERTAERLAEALA